MKKVFMTILGLAAAMPTMTYARPLHVALTSDGTQAAAAQCVFPNGTAIKSIPGLHCYSPSQLMDAYGITKLHQAGITGKGQTIVLVDSYGSPSIQGDLDVFSDSFGIPRTMVQFVYPNGTYVNPMQTADQQSWASETTLDVEWAHALAPDATIVNVVTSSDEIEGIVGLPDLFAGIKMAIEQYPGAVVSMSFAADEPTFTADDIKNYLNGSFDDTLREAVATHATLLAGSGDWGTANYNFDMSSYLSNPNVNYPASSPFVTAVGGTWLQSGWKWNPQGTADDYWACQLGGSCGSDFWGFTSAPGETTEAVWKEDWAAVSTGGGVSTLFHMPIWQAGVGLKNLEAMKGYRALPDVSMNAAINGGVMIYHNYTGAPTGKWGVEGGTSCATPETAALVALAGQRASDMLGQEAHVGLLNAVLYALPGSDFNDVTSQSFGTSNQVTLDTNTLYFNSAVLAADGPTTVPPVNVPGDATTSGYDMATGRGSPKAESFVQHVAFAVMLRELSGF